MKDARAGASRADGELQPQRRMQGQAGQQGPPACVPQTGLRKRQRDSILPATGCTDLSLGSLRCSGFYNPSRRCILTILTYPLLWSSWWGRIGAAMEQVGAVFTEEPEEMCVEEEMRTMGLKGSCMRLPHRWYTHACMDAGILP